MVSAPSEVEIDRVALAENLEALRELLAPAELCMVVKANAYGHGLDPTVPVALASGHGSFATFSAAEAARVRRLAPGARIQVMGHVAPHDISWLARNGVEAWVGREGTWEALQAAAEAGIGPFRVHLEIETGMHRTGLDPERALEIGVAIDELPTVQWVGTCTHLAGAESPKNQPRLEKQVRVFDDTIDSAKDLGLDPGQQSIASSSAGILYPEWRRDMVRMGIASYGLWPTPEVKEAAADFDWDPRPVLSWRSRIWSIAPVRAGEPVGYGSHGVSDEDRLIAIVPVGYGDGFARGLWDGGSVLVQGEEAPVVGMVNMNMIQIDVTDIRPAEGDEVVLIGEQAGKRRSVRSFAEEYDMINYELMTRLAQHLPRRGIRGPTSQHHQPDRP